MERISYLFTPIPNNLEDVLTPSEERLYRIFIYFAQRGIFDPCIRLLASTMKRTDRTVQRLIRSLERKQLLEIVEQRVSSCRNDSNIYKLVGLGLSGEPKP
jgi:DNA-binding MarR family transcriptional regulator